jgi:hypothetical protein
MAVGCASPDAQDNSPYPKRGVAAVLLVLVLLAAGCGGADQSSDAATPAKTQDRQQEKRAGAAGCAGSPKARRPGSVAVVIVRTITTEPRSVWNARDPGLRADGPISSMKLVSLGHDSGRKRGAGAESLCWGEKKNPPNTAPPSGIEVVV